MNDLNTGFLLDIWHDLKEKRLAPVAIGLMVALIAIPALMMKGGDGGGDVPLPVPVSGPAGTGAEVSVAGERSEGGSKLDSYEARDPFKGLDTGSEEKSEDGSAVAPIDAAGAEKSGGGGGSTGSTDVTGITGGSDTGSSESDTTGTDPGTGTGTAPVDTPPVKRETSFYNFRLDVKFGKPGREKRRKSAARLSFFTVAGHPVALFLGVNEQMDKALFLVTPGLNHQGEGECIPKPTDCDFMSLEIGKEHYFSANDREFRMELLDIDKVKASEDKKQREIARKAAQRSAARADEGGGVSTDAQVEQYDWPLLVDGMG